jgi:4,5-dihydroxyphthalate decarboxylase
MTTPRVLKALIGDYTVTAALKSGAVRSDRVAFDFADVKVPNTAFPRVVRHREFDVAELAIVTFLIAKARGVPLTLLPAVLVARFQHPYLVYNAERGRLTPTDLAGRRVGIRSYTVTTAMWIRSILADDHGVDLGRVRWVTFEDAHVAGVGDPPGVERAAPGKVLLDMLLSGELDAAVVGAPPTDPRLETLIADPAAAARTWQRKYGAIQLNHLVAVKTELCQSEPETVREVYRLFEESRRRADLPVNGEEDLNPFGLDANRRNLEVAIDAVCRQGLIPRPYSLDEILCPAIT